MDLQNANKLLSCVIAALQSEGIKISSILATDGLMILLGKTTPNSFIKSKIGILKKRKPDTDCPSNKLGIGNLSALVAAETICLFARALEAILNMNSATFDTPYILSLHKQLYGDLYEDCGRLRTTNCVYKQSTYADYRYIPRSLDNIFKKATSSLTKKILTKQKYATLLTLFFHETYILRPFQYGNAVTRRMFFLICGIQNGYCLDYFRCDTKTFLDAERGAFVSDNVANLYDCIVKCLSIYVPHIIIKTRKAKPTVKKKAPKKSAATSAIKLLTSPAPKPIATDSDDVNSDTATGDTKAADNIDTTTSDKKIENAPPAVLKQIKKIQIKIDKLNSKLFQILSQYE